MEAKILQPLKIAPFFGFQSTVDFPALCRKIQLLNKILTWNVENSYLQNRLIYIFFSIVVVTTFKTTTAPLSEVFFPAVVLCNINQIRGSMFKRLGIGNNAKVINLLFEEFYTGR